MAPLWAELTHRGYRPVEPLGRGMEGAVFRIAGGGVAKAWHARTAADLAPLRAFYRELADQELPFATPEILDAFDVDGRAVTIERELTGASLRTALSGGLVSRETASDATVDVVAALRETRAGRSTRALPVLGEPAALRGDAPWGTALTGLVSRRAAASRALLAVSVEDFDAKLERLLSLLARLPDPPDAVVHGDICPENILVDGRGRVSAVLDWGFLTTAGDNAFEAATAAGFFDMYGPDARAADDLLLARLAGALGHPRELMLLYRAAYAVATATSYAADGADGHFAWCVAALNRPDIADVLRAGA